MVLDRIRARLRPGTGLPPTARIEAIVARHGGQPWFVYAYRDWQQRFEPRETCRWIARHCRPECRILETACGAATNLVWLWQHGFRSLDGFDLDPRALAISQDICASLGAGIRLWRDDALNPSALPATRYDLVLAIGWACLLDAFDLTRFFDTYRDCLGADGLIAIDLIDARYDELPGNRYLTSDQHLPESQRRPSEYRQRFSGDQVGRAAAAAGMHVVHRISQPSSVPRVVYILRRSPPGAR